MKAWEPQARGIAGGGLRVAVVDYGAGNLVSIEQALRAVRAEPARAREPDDLRAVLSMNALAT